MMEKHRRAVQDLQLQVKKGISSKRSPTASHTVRSHKNLDGLRLDLSGMNRILSVDKEKLIALVEPKVSMEMLVKGLLPYGLVPPVIAEFKGITVGGAINGASLESSSHLHGQFNDICEAYYVLLSDGSIVRASRDQNTDLFHGISGSYGSLGQILSIEVKLVPVKKWVRVKFQRCNSIDLTIKKIGQENRKKDPPEFLEGLIFGNDHGVVIEGRFVDHPENGFVVQQSNYWNPWYYQVIRQKSRLLSEGQAQEFYMPVIDYLFRYDRGAFWMGTYALHGRLLMNYWTGRWKSGPFHELKDPGKLFRGLWGWACTSKNLYSILHMKGESWFARKGVIQDFYLPESKTSEFAEKALEMSAITPLWICPVKITKEAQLFAPHAIEGELAYDVGVYGFPKGDLEGDKVTCDLENLTHKLGGRKMLYSYSFFDEETFWKVYPKDEYLKLKNKWDSANNWACIVSKVLQKA